MQHSKQVVNPACNYLLALIAPFARVHVLHNLQLSEVSAMLRVVCNKQTSLCTVTCEMWLPVTVLSFVALATCVYIISCRMMLC